MYLSVYRVSYSRQSTTGATEIAHLIKLVFIASGWLATIAEAYPPYDQPIIATRFLSKNEFFSNTCLKNISRSTVN